jgi:hypothetical protein
MLNQYWMISPVLEETDADLYTDFTSWDWEGQHGGRYMALATGMSFLLPLLPLFPSLSLLRSLSVFVAQL